MDRPLTTLLRIAGLAAFGLALGACGDTDTATDLPSPSDPSIARFTAEPASLAAGGTTTLSWVVADADDVQILRATEEVHTSGEATGSFTPAAIDDTTEFTLVATRGARTVRQSLTVTVSGPIDPEVVRFSATPNPVEFQATTTIEWEVTGADAVEITVGQTTVVDGGAATGSRMIDVDDVNGLLARLRATHASGGETTRTLTIEVIAPPGLEVEPNDSPSEATELDDEGRATARIDTATDQDHFVIQVPEGGYVRAETSDGSGGCAVGNQLTLLDDAAEPLATGQLAEFVFDGQGQAIEACRRIEPRLSAGARNLPAGTYYLRVDVGEFSPSTGSYQLDVEVGPPGCGNGIIESGETCDDGNTSDGDNCPATCQAAPAGVVATADGAANRFAATLGPSDVMVVNLTVSADATLVAEVGTGEVGVCDEQLIVTVLDDSGAQVGQSFGFAINQQSSYACGRVDPDRAPTASNLPAGSYVVRAERAPGAESDLDVAMMVRLHDGQGCGNGYREGEEACDDGDADDSDYCSSSCAPNPIPIDGISEAVVVGTRWDPYRVIRAQVAAGQTVQTRVTPVGGATCSTETVMGMLTTGDPAQLVGVSSAGTCVGIEHPGSQYAVEMEAGTYDLAVLNGDTGVGQAVTVDGSVLTPGCGNGAIETSRMEACDDGNTIDTDACTNSCTVNQVTASESEPNNQLDEADGLSVTAGGALTQVSAGLSNGNDVDIFGISLPANAELELLTYTAANDRSACDGIDTILFLVDEMGNTLASNDDTNGLCSRLATSADAGLRNLPAGSYFVAVRAYPNTPGGAYYLDVILR